jgi:hypothetical protein
MQTKSLHKPRMIKRAVHLATKKSMDIRDQHVFRLWEGATKKVK